MNKKVSIVIPVYNVERYLGECLDSIVNQTYKNLQIILVDDGSTDNSGKICDEYAQNDNRITVVHQENQGAGAAKNTGLDLVEGEYLSLIDSDDYIEYDFYEVLVSGIEEHNADVVQCLFRKTFVNNSYDRRYNFSSTGDRVLTSKKYLFEMLYDWKYAVFWNKLFKASLLGETRFPVDRKIDDEFFTYKLICNAKKIVNIDDVLYNYRMRQSSVMNENDNEKLIRDRIDSFEERLGFIKKVYPNLNKFFNKHISEYLNNISLSSDKKFNEFINCQKNQFPLKNDNMVSKLYFKIKLRNFSPNTKVFNHNDEEFFE